MKDSQRKAMWANINKGKTGSSVGMEFNSEKELNDYMQGKQPNKREAYDGYILSSISKDGYDVPKDKYLGDKGRLQFLYDRFRDEYYNGNQQAQAMGEQNSFREWIQGVPSSFNIEFENYKILELAKEKGTLPQNATEKQEDRVIENYWNFMANKVFQLFRKHGIVR